MDRPVKTAAMTDERLDEIRRNVQDWSASIDAARARMGVTGKARDERPTWAHVLVELFQEVERLRGLPVSPKWPEEAPRA